MSACRRWGNTVRGADKGRPKGASGEKNGPRRSSTHVFAQGGEHFHGLFQYGNGVVVFLAPHVHYSQLVENAGVVVCKRGRDDVSGQWVAAFEALGRDATAKRTTKGCRPLQVTSGEGEVVHVRLRHANVEQRQVASREKAGSRGVG